MFFKLVSIVHDCGLPCSNQMAFTFSIMLLSVIGLCCLRQVAILCSPGCASCVNGDNICDYCKEGFWPYNNECSPCPENCKTCSDNKTCQSCLPHFYGLDIYKCQHPCSNMCTNSECQDKNGYCYKCFNGSYGPICGESCNLCKNAQCDLRKCSQGCADGYVQSDSGDCSYCYPCPPNCLNCLNATYCTQCTEQYYPLDYILYERGRSECWSCLGSCTNCESILHCSSCYQTAGKLECIQCIDGYVLEKTQCVKVTTKICQQTCNEGCDESRMCIGGCKDGYVGPYCSYPCLENCLKCKTQVLCASCEDGLYTETCSQRCNENCLIGGIPRCRFEDGYCLNGCSDGKWGETCENTCSLNCRSYGNSLQLCHRNGTCSYGCDDGFRGSDCSNEVITTTTTTTTTKTSISMLTRLTTVLSSARESSAGVHVTTVSFPKEESSSFGAVIGGAVTGTFIITTVVVGSIAFLLHRRSILKRRNEEQQADRVYYNTSATSTTVKDGTNNYNNVMDSTIISSEPSETTVYDKLSRTNSEHVYSGL